LLRLYYSVGTHSHLMCALSDFKVMEAHSPAGITDLPVFRYLAQIRHWADAHAYVSEVSHLVYATTILDTFLSDTTVFLFLLFPSAMGKNQQVPLRTIIDSSSRNDALTKAAQSRARELSYLPFPARIQALRERFGLNVELSPAMDEALEYYPTVRNSAVHDQGLYEVRLDEAGQVECRQKTCPLHPTKLAPEDLSKAIDAYHDIGRRIARSIMCQILKQEANPSVSDFLKMLSSEWLNRYWADGASLST
jgi:hypothetical protein